MHGTMNIKVRQCSGWQHFILTLYAVQPRVLVTGHFSVLNRFLPKKITIPSLTQGSYRSFWKSSTHYPLTTSLTKYLLCPRRILFIHSNPIPSRCT